MFGNMGELRIKQREQNREGWGGWVRARQQRQPFMGRSQDDGAHPRQGGKSELLRVACPSDPLRSCSHWDRRKEEGWPELRSRGRVQVGRRSGCLIRLEVRGGAGPEIRPGRNRMSVLEREGEDSAKNPGLGHPGSSPSGPVPGAPPYPPSSKSTLGPGY